MLMQRLLTFAHRYPNLALTIMTLTIDFALGIVRNLAAKTRQRRVLPRDLPPQANRLGRWTAGAFDRMSNGAQNHME